MKKIFKFCMMMIALTVLGLQSCSKDDDGPTMNDIVGTWKISQVSTDGGLTYKTWTLETTTATFNANGTYSGRGYFGNGSGTWKQKGNTITTYIDGKSFYVYEVKELTAATCILTMAPEGESEKLWIKCIKTSGGDLGSESTLISKSELEKITSFECNDNGNMIYLKFRDGHIYTKEITSSGFVCNEDDIIYTLSGDKISMSFAGQNPSGTIYKIKYSNGKIGILINLNGSYGIATWLSKEFKESSYNF